MSIDEGAALEYRFKLPEYNGLRGKIGEQLARSFIRNQLAPKLVNDESWDYVLFSNNDHKQRVRTLKTKLFDFDNFRDDFLILGFYPKAKLLSKYASAIGILNRNHCVPDGLLLKLKRTGGYQRLWKKSCPSEARFRLKATADGNHYRLLTVEGALEIVEVKCGRSAKLMEKQKETYSDLIEKGFPLRMISVRIISFDLNKFLVEEHRYERFL